MIDMVQQTKDSKFCEYGLANSEAGLPNTAKQISTPLSTKKTVLRDLQNENGKLAPKPSAALSDESRPTNESVKTSGPKRSATESLNAPLLQKFPMSNPGNGHLVYVRRKPPDADLGRSNACDNQNLGVGRSQLRETNVLDESTQKKSQVKESKVCSPEISSVPMPSSVGFSSARHSDSTFTEKSNNILCQENLNHPHTSTDPGNPVRVNSKHWEERYIQLQNLLETLDQSDQNDYIQSMFFHLIELLHNTSLTSICVFSERAFSFFRFGFLAVLRSLPSVELSQHAVELEKRAIYLSLKEGNTVPLGSILFPLVIGSIVYSSWLSPLPVLSLVFSKFMMEAWVSQAKVDCLSPYAGELTKYFTPPGREFLYV